MTEEAENRQEQYSVPNGRRGERPNNKYTPILSVLCGVHSL